MTKPTDVYLLLGPEQGAKEDFIIRIAEQIAKKTGQEPERHKIYPFETEMSSVIALLRNGSLFSPHKLVTVYGTETIKKKDDVNLLIDYYKRPSPEATLLLLSDSVKVDPRLTKTITGNSKKIFWEMFDNQKSGWIHAFFQKYGISIKPEAVELILDMVENNTKDLRIECERLAGFLGPNTIISEEEIENFLYHSKEENIFSLFDAVAELDFTRTLDILQKLQLSGEATPVSIFGGLLWQFKKLLQLHHLLKNNYKPEEAFTAVKLTSKRVRRTYQRGYENYSHEKLEYIIRLIAHYDTYVRELPSDSHPLLLSLFLYYTVQQDRTIQKAFLPREPRAK